MTRKKTDKVSNAGDSAQSLAIRKSHLGEAFYLTGHGILRHCVHIQEFAGQSDLIAERYMTIVTPSFNATMAWAQPILFREAVSETGECFAYPQLLGDPGQNQDARAVCERLVFTEPLGHWIAIDQCEDCGEFYHSINILEEDYLVFFHDFAELLDATLLPHLIDNDDHPTYQRLQAILDELVDDESSNEYGEEGE